MDECKQCGKPMNPVAVLIGPVCGTCARENHSKAVTQHRVDDILTAAREGGPAAGQQAVVDHFMDILKK